jgi:hypothetical protein
MDYKKPYEEKLKNKKTKEKRANTPFFLVIKIETNVLVDRSQP